MSMVLWNLMVPGLNFTSLKKGIIFKRKTHMFYFRSENLSMEHTSFLTLHSVDAVGIKNATILFKNA